LHWATFFGGTGNDAAYDIEIEASGSLIIAGGTQSTNLPGMNGLNSILSWGHCRWLFGKIKCLQAPLV
jgi:hypothetical protein